MMTNDRAAVSLAVDIRSLSHGPAEATHRASSAQRPTWISLPIKTVPMHVPVDMVSQTHQDRGVPGESTSDLIEAGMRNVSGGFSALDALSISNAQKTAQMRN